ncbi:MAG TPA: M48 family metallopeptidase [Burkholderiales bacterium]|nr:M48 family metallopeptidase [Burkholderiales bacterium]
MSILRARYFDSQRSIGHDVSVILGSGALKLVGRDIDLHFDSRQVRVAPRVADAPRWIYLPGGGACALEDNDAVDALAREGRFARFLHRLESRPAYAALALALVVAALWVLIDRGVPAAAEQVALRIPPATESVLGRETLAALDRYWMKPSTLPAMRRAALSARFHLMAEAARDLPPHRLVFRSSPRIGPNAFALPAGTIVITDQLVALAHSDSEVLAVLAHELGHVAHRHVMRRLLQGSATALIIAGVTGDITSTTSLAASAPVLLLQAKYSRDYEREADRYGIGLLRKAHIPPRSFALILERLQAAATARHRGGVPGFLASHPSTEEREALAREAATH